jgi:hypothetical protein
MKLLINCNKSLLSTKFDITVLRQLEYLKDIYTQTFYCGIGWELDLFTAYNKYHPDIILFAADFDYNDWKMAPDYNNVIKVMYMQDYWFCKEKRYEILNYGNFHALITKNFSGLHEYKQKFPFLKFYVNPSGFDENIFYPTYNEKTYDILICGILDKNVYPQRFRLANIARNLETKVKVYQKPHCGWFSSVGNNEQSIFANYINQSKIVISGTALLNLYMQKTWEISACSALCITDVNPNEPEFDLITNHVIKIDMSLSDNDIADIYLQEINNFNYEITKSYNKVVYSYATLHHRANQLLNILKHIYNNGEQTQT